MKITMPELLSSARVDRETLDLWVEAEWIVPAAVADDLTFSERDLARVNLIRDLTVDFGVNEEGISVILHLLDQVHGLRRALAESLHGQR